ncbi:hypothetical protein [Streptomyces atriruber]|uniref:hypothetical protein n=1 Tax=Streptomyces atriruber TaxID=545121 RepID=UPI0006E2817B|nr:hypothetical protein [Streptomyces atriruber]
MIRIVTQARVEQLVRGEAAADERARQVTAAANEAFGRHVRELYAVTDRAERAEVTTAEVGEILAHALDELAVAQEELLLRRIEIRRLREELDREPLEGQTLTVLLHYGEPHTIYRSREEAKGDTATHGLTADRWAPCDERRACEVEWRVEAFIYDAISNGFRRAFAPAPEPVGGAA